MTTEARLATGTVTSASPATALGEAARTTAETSAGVEASAATGVGPTALELKLLASAALALVYVGALFGVARPEAVPRSAAARPATRPRPTAPAPPEPRWLEQLPPFSRPAVVAPEGWEVSSLSLAIAAPSPAPRLTRVEPPRPFRTRSS